MPEMLMQPVAGPGAWKGRDLRDRGDWIYRFTKKELDEVDRALRETQAKGHSLESIGRGDFPLPTFGKRLNGMLADVRDGRGFAVLRGLPTDRYSDDEVFTILWGIGRHCGHPISQNSYGDVLGHVYDHGVKMGEGRVRGYQTSQHLRFHTDRADMTVLLCLRTARRGGASSLVSSIAIHDEILSTRPDLLPALYAGYPVIHVEEGGDSAPRRIPVFSVAEGMLSCGIQRNTVETAIQAGAMPISEIEKEALDKFDEFANAADFRLDMDLQPGDLQFCNNYTVMHARTAYEDDPDPAKRRHLVRLWLAFETRRPVAPHFADYNVIAQDLTR